MKATGRVAGITELAGLAYELMKNQDLSGFDDEKLSDLPSDDGGDT